MARAPLGPRCHIELFLWDDVTCGSFPEKEPHPSRHLTSLKGCSPQTGAINSAISCLSLICLEAFGGVVGRLEGGLRRGGYPRSVQPASQPAVSLKVFWLKHRAIKIDLDSDSFFHLSFAHLFFLPLWNARLHIFTTWLITCCCFSVHCVPFLSSLLRSCLFTLRSAGIRRRDKCGCHDTRGSQWAGWSLRVCRVQPVTDRPARSKLTFHLLTFSSMLIINPTYSALPVSLHHKLTFLFFFSLPLPPFSVLLCPFPFTSLPVFSSPVILPLAAKLFTWK